MPTPFTDLDAFLALPRLGGLALSPDGTRLVTSVATLAPDRTRWVSALWEVDPTGAQPARRLTRSAPGEAAPAFLPDGDLLFVSKRPSPPAKEGAGDGDDRPALWLLPVRGGEARQVATRPGGVTGVAVARDSGAVVVSSPTMPGASDAEADTARRTARKDAKVSALLHETYPIRFWDHDLGPDAPHLLVADGEADDEKGHRDGPSAGPQSPPPDVPGDETSYALRDLTPEPGRALDDQRFVPTPDGTAVVTGWVVPAPRGELRVTVTVLDVVSGDRRPLVDEEGYDAEDPDVSADGRHVVCVLTRHSGYDEPPQPTLWLVPLDGGPGRDLLPGVDLQPAAPRFTADGKAVLFVADQAGHAPVFRIDLDTGRLTRLTASGAYSDLCPSPDARSVYAVHNALDRLPTPVRLDARAADQAPSLLRAPGADVTVPGRIVEVTTTAADGVPLRSWLAMPADASASDPAPLLVFIHGGPMGSWNTWHWRWNPWTAVARGYAVLLPDPALSTGYGHAFLRRGWGRWGEAPYTDLMSLTDAALARDDLDGERTAALGGSFGGYMANWVAGHTDRFSAIVTHASLWTLEQMFGTTDVASYWEREFGSLDTHAERYAAGSPHHHADRIRTPMLVIHGDKDYRVPISEALRLWWDLTRHEVEAKFLYFPDENHWVLTPGNAKVWYETVLAFCDHHVLGKEWARPGLL
ncbi:MAG: S9 family peptidase [Actinomycetes bacterium]